MSKLPDRRTRPVGAIGAAIKVAKIGTGDVEADHELDRFDSDQNVAFVHK